MASVDTHLIGASLEEVIYQERMRRKESNPESVFRFYDDPLGFVMWAYRWGLPGPLERFQGPDAWQRDILIELGEEVKKRAFNGRDAVSPIRMSLATGHGCGKSVLGAWLVTWLMSTRRYAQGTVTANTYTQLETKTWAAIQHWFKSSRVAAEFAISASGIQHRIYGKSWKCSPQTCREENSESFAGQHAATSTSFYLFDEASSIPDKIWEVAEGGLTDGAPAIFAFGNPTRASGKFYRINFGDEQARWNHHVIDSRDCMMPNKTQIQEWIEDWGEDSDFVRVRVKGLPPQAGDMQYIPSTSVYAAQKRMVEVLADEPLIAGVDLARGGGDNAVVFFRRGGDARSIKPIVIPGEIVRDSMLLVSKLADLTTQKFNGIPVTIWFLDGGGIGGPIIDRMKQLGHINFIEIQFGSRAPDDKHFTNMRAYMWSKMRDWLTDRGAVDPKDRQLEIDLTGVGLANRSGKDDRILLESKESMKKRGLDSPDRADALCFVKNTMVQTPGGPVAIQNIRKGDLVTTPFGLSEVAIVHVSDADSLTTSDFSNGSSLCGKASHDIFTFSHGPTRLDALSLTNEVEIYSQWRVILWRLVSLFFIGDKSIGFKQQAFTFNPGDIQTRSAFFIAGFTQTITGLSLMATTFITKMGTGVTALQEILSLRTNSPMVATICSSDYGTQSREQKTSNILSWLESLPPNGMDLQRELNGTRSTESMYGKQGHPYRPPALDVERNTKPTSRLDPGFVPVPVCSRWPSGLISRIKEFVLGAARDLWLTVIGRRPVVPVSVRTENVEPTATYNLTLKKHNAYYANGILVFNCLTFARPVTAPPLPAQKPPQRIYQELKNRGSGWMA